MKFFVTDFTVDNAIMNGVLTHYFRRVEPMLPEEVVVVPDISLADVVIWSVYDHRCRFQCDERLMEAARAKPIVVFDYIEGIWASQVFGYLRKKYPRQDNPDYDKLADWGIAIADRIVAYFKREMTPGYTCPVFPVYPIDFLADAEYFFRPRQTDTYEQFLARRNSVAHIYSSTNPGRFRLHGELMRQWNYCAVVTDERMIDNRSPGSPAQSNRALLLNRPPAMRLPFDEYMEICKDSRIAVSLCGTGRKCHRDREACFNSVMAIQDRRIDSAFPWRDGENAIVLPSRDELWDNKLLVDETAAVKKIQDWLGDAPKLYELYLRGIEHALNYRIDNYFSRYLLPAIKSATEPQKRSFVRVNRAKPRSLVCIIGQTRAGRLTWPTLKEKVLDEWGADLALCIGSSEEPNEFHSNAKYVWKYDEPADISDWTGVFDEVGRQLGATEDWRVLVDEDTRFLFGLCAEKWAHGVSHPHTRGTGGLLLFFRWLLLQKLRENQLLGQYDRFLVTRSDYFYVSPHMPLEYTDPDLIYIPDGETYGGVTDRHFIANPQDTETILGFLEDVILRPRETRDFLHKFGGPWNLERFLATEMNRRGMLSRVRFFPFVMFAVRDPEDKKTVYRSSQGQLNPKVNMLSKFAGEVDSAMESKRSIRWREDWRPVLLPTVPPVAVENMPKELRNRVGMPLTLIMPGEFDMGASPEETASLLSENKSPQQEDNIRFKGPRHHVTLTRPFYMGVFPVTQEEYQQVMGTNPSTFSTGQPDVSMFPEHQRENIRNDQEMARKNLAAQNVTDTRRHPVETVSWDDAMEFCRRLSAMPEEVTAGRVYRLPTEAEWEYACRAGTTTRWYCGDDEQDVAPCGWLGNSSKGTTKPVGERCPNAWGLHDMFAHVWQWCMDRSGGHYPPIPMTDPVGPPIGGGRVLRGITFGGGTSTCRSAFRHFAGIQFRRYVVGFRVVAELK